LPFGQNAIDKASDFLNICALCFVEKIVDFFRVRGEEIQNSSLAKGCSFLIDIVTYYLSMTIKMATYSVGR